MACTSLSMINPPVTRSFFRRSFSDSSICCSVNHIRNSAPAHKLKKSRSTAGNIFSLKFPSSFIPGALRSFLLDLETVNYKEIQVEEMVLESDDDTTEGESDPEQRRKRSNWVERLLELRTDWSQKQKNDDDDAESEEDKVEGCDEHECEVRYDDDDEDEGEMKSTFSNMLRRVSSSDIMIFSRLAFLCNMAYVIPEIKAKDLRRYYGLDFVTSSIMMFEQDSMAIATAAHHQYNKPQEKRSLLPRPSVAYEIAASAASYVQSRAKDLLSQDSSPQGDWSKSCEECELEESSTSSSSEMAAAYVVAASAVTAVVAAGEKTKEEAARELQSPQSSPCDWFVCDDSTTRTRCFIIQDTDVLVHRGIYEAAKGIYEQFLPTIKQHLSEHGDEAKFQFTGHSLGGSLSLLVNLMLLTRKVVSPTCLLPVVMFGAPYVFCGGEKVLEQLGLNENHVHSVMMHRDIVPRAFSCNYPNHVATVLKRLNATFRSHPCLNKNKLLYSPMGKTFILQPDEKLSPPHPLLPTGSALYTLENNNCSSTRKALRAFLNSPHPLETLSDPTAYGSNGTILRDHDSSNYLRAVNEMIRKHRMKPPRVIRKSRKQRNIQWPLLTSQSPHAWTQEYCGVMENTSPVRQLEIMTTGV
ncbi:phospholipase A1 PLIP1, chloroplastic isoform X2 [Ipomoea triloba]|uniref:phospholipase A1 PLIP1, chloroplastic isoform X2 n=1 Tax=Ipomoea triloba TaxID=35885 RepID=UPI00125CEA92|nr:phospholipase A1 PLIP1, chloroplastic isoform X2 [Ipomoea triloba]